MKGPEINTDEWWLEKHRDLVKKSSITKDDVLDFETLNKNLNEYSANLSYVIKEHSDANFQTDRIKRGYEIWYNSKFAECRSELIKEGEKTPLSKLIESRITQKYEKEYTDWNEKIANAEYQTRILSEFVKIWSGLGYVYHNLSENMRFDMATSADKVEQRMNTSGAEMLKLRRRG